MIALTRAQARVLRTVLRKSAPLAESRAYHPVLSFQASREGMRIRAHHAQVAVQWQLPGARSPEVIVIPSQVLDNVEGRQEDVVELTQVSAESVAVRWLDQGVHQCREYASTSLEAVPAFPEEPARFTPLEDSFRRAFTDAAQIAGRNQGRYATTLVQLRGSKGEIVSTDGGQLLVQRGMCWPWKQDLLVPAIGVLACRELPQEETFTVGKTENHVSLRTGAWIFHLAIDKTARFPVIDKVIPSAAGKSTTLHLAQEDAVFLAKALPR